MTVAAIIVMEVGCALWVRVNLTLNIIMLVHAMEAITTWLVADSQDHEMDLETSPDGGLQVYFVIPGGTKAVKFTVRDISNKQ